MCPRIPALHLLREKNDAVDDNNYENNSMKDLPDRVVLGFMGLLLHV
jgi:hypothetical protein